MLSTMLDDARLVAFLASADLERSDRFFSAVIGLTRTPTNQFSNLYLMPAGALRVAKVDQPVIVPYTVLGWWVKDIRAEMARLAALGVEFLTFPGMDQDEQGIWTAPSGSWIAWFPDPDGNILSLSQDPGHDPPG